MVEPEKARYRKQASGQLDRKAAEQLKVEAVPSEDDAVLLRMAGKCPLCRHETVFEYPLLAFQGVEEGANSRESLLAVAKTVGLSSWSGDARGHCCCGQGHKDHPDNEDGCGARWGIHVSWGQP